MKDTELTKELATDRQREFGELRRTDADHRKELGLRIRRFRLLRHLSQRVGEARWEQRQLHQPIGTRNNERQHQFIAADLLDAWRDFG